MKKFIVFPVAIAALFIVALSCNKNLDKGAGSQLSSSLKNQLEESGMRLPNGTTFNQIKDASGNITRIDFALPQDCGIYGVSASGAIMADNGGSLTCTCSGTGGCKPFSAKGKMGCLVDGCSKCTGTTATKLTSSPLDFFLIRNGELQGLSALALLADTRPVYSFEEWQSAAFPTTAEATSNDFAAAIDDLMDYCNQFDKKDMVGLAYLVNGKKILVNVPFAALDNGTMYGMAVGNGNYSCSGSCNGGTTKCKLESGQYGSIYYCEGCPSGCTLSAAK